MREPFHRILPQDEPLLAAGESEPGVTTGPLAGLAEMLALFSPILSVILAVRLDGWQAKILGAVLPPLVMIALARYPLRRWHRPRQWIGVTNRGVLIWRRPAAIRPRPRIEDIPLHEIAGVELTQDDWDRHAGTHQLVLHLPKGPRNLDRVHNAERLHDAIVAAVPAALQPAAAEPSAGPPPRDFLPPPPAPGDYRPG